jgi:hypothetical protein
VRCTELARTVWYQVVGLGVENQNARMGRPTADQVEILESGNRLPAEIDQDHGISQASQRQLQIGLGARLEPSDRVIPQPGP